MTLKMDSRGYLRGVFECGQKVVLSGPKWL